MSTSPSSRQESHPRYWCYTCNAQVQVYMAPDLTCQQCNEQFIEEIDSENDPQSFLAGADDSQADRGPDTSFFRYETGGADDDIFHIYAPMGGRNEEGGEANPNQPLAAMLQNLLSTMLNPTGQMQQPGQQSEEDGEQQHGDGQQQHGDGQQQQGEQQQGEQQHGEQQQRRQPYLFYGSMLDGNVQFRPMNMPSQQNGEGGDMRAEFTFEMHNNRSTEEQEEGDGNRPNPMASLMQIISAITGGPLGEGFVGNPDDYVFSQNALDNIISQLMEQTSGRNAPPPAPEAVIDSLPKRKLTDQEIAQQTDCAVCKDEFAATEQVIELPCAHLFHDECIKPWLKVNGTCPVCRHGVVSEKEQPEHDDSNASSSQQPDEPQQAPPPPSSSTPAQERQPADTPTSTLSSLLFEGARRMYNDRSPSSGWHSSIPGPFTWGPGGRSPSSTNNTSNGSNNNSNGSNNNENDNTQQQRSSDSNNNNENNNNNDMMDLDLD